MKLKHLICIVLSIILILSCTACKNSSGKESTDGFSNSTASHDGESQAFGTVGGEETDSTEPSSPANTETSSPDNSGGETSSNNGVENTTEASTEERFVYTFEPRNETVYTTADLNIRRGPYNDAQIVDVAPAGTKLTRVGYQYYWSQVEYKGEILYASSTYLTETAPTTAAPPTEAPTETGGSSSASNRSRSFGYVRNQRDDKNVPKAMYEYVNLWGDRADYLQDTSQNVVYLTMDEGYEAGNTPTILDILKEKNVKAVFFLTKQFVDECPHLVQRMIDEGHILGNHTCSHPAAGMPSLSVEAQENDIMTLHNMVLNQFGYEGGFL